MSSSQRTDVTIVRRVAFEPWWSPFGRFAEQTVRSIPSHRDSRTGRRNAAQVRVIFLAVGIATVVLWDSGWAVLGFAALALAFIVPISESRRRGLVAQLRTARTGHTRLARSPGILETSDRHVTLLQGDERLRRLLRKDLVVETQATRLELRSGKKKTERIVIATTPPTEPDLDLWAEVDALPNLTVD